MSSAVGSSFDGAGVAATANQMGPSGLQDALGPEEFDGLLHPNVLETLADFDFSYADLGEGTGAEAPQQQQQQQQQQQPQQKLSGRKRSLPQSCSWDNLSPKAISEMSASLLAGSGWDISSINNSSSSSSSSNNNSPQEPGQTITPACARAAAAPAAAADAAPCSGNNNHGNPTGPPVAAAATTAAATGAVEPQHQHQAGNNNNNNGKAHAGAGCSKGRRGAGAGAASGGGAGSAKRLLNPDRMERKASREKRRREEVNQQFDQLLKVLEDAEATSGLEPPPAKEGKAAAHACINGRRVEVLSRTIKVLKKLLQERRDSLACRAAATAATAGSPCAQEGGSRDRSQGAVEEEAPPLAVTGAAATAAPAVSDVFGSAAESVHFAGDAAEAKDACTPQVLEAPVLAAGASVPGAGSEINPSSVMQHMAVPLSGHHASMMMPPGFAGMSGHAMSTPNAPGHHGQPIFFAVPMFMPQGHQGQGMPAQGVDKASQSPPTVATSLPAPVPPAVATAAQGVVEKVEPAMTAPSGKETWAMPAGMGYQTMVLPTPQFVTQALSTDEADEKPTHAVCA